MPLDLPTPRAFEASDGRVVLVAPAAARGVELSVGGRPVASRVTGRVTAGARVRITVRVAAVAGPGTLRATVRDARGRVRDRGSAAGVVLLGPRVFARPATPRADAAATARAEAARDAVAPAVGISAVCIGTGRRAESGAARPARAGRALVPAVLAAALAQPDPPGADDLRAALTEDDTEAVNRILTGVGGGDQAEGVARVNALMQGLGMRASRLDGPYRSGAGPSGKTTSARDLRVLMEALLAAARDGGGPLGRVGVQAGEARRLLAAMASRDEATLVPPGPRRLSLGAGARLSDARSEVVLIAGGGAPCIAALTVASGADTPARTVGARVAAEVLPALRRPVAAPHAVDPSPGPAPAAPPDGGAAPPAAGAAEGDGGGDDPWGWVGLGLGGVVLAAAGAIRAAQLRARRRRRARRTRRDPTAPHPR